MVPEVEEQAEVVRIGRHSFLRRMALSAGSGGTACGLIAAASVPDLVRVLLPSAGILLEVGLTSVFVIVAVVIGLVIAALIVPGFRASPDGSWIRVGRRAVPVESIRRAAVQVERAAGPRGDLVLQLRSPHLRTAVWLRYRTRVLLTEQVQRVLLHVLDRSRIEAPRSAYDPTGRFTHTNFPGASTKEEALDLVRRLSEPSGAVPLHR